MRQVILCEKPSVQRSVIAVFGETQGKVLALAGHFLELAEPRDIRPEWKAWTTGILWPGHLYPLTPVPTKAAAVEAMRGPIMSADHVIVATDPDREGDLIGGEILDYFGFKGRVSRVLFQATDEKSIRDAFAKIAPFSTRQGQYNAARTRQQADKIVNLSLTRTVTSLYVPKEREGLIGVGRVRTPTLGILCRREKEILAFKAQDLFRIKARITAAAGAFDLICDRMPSGAVLNDEATDDADLASVKGEDRAALEEAESTDDKIKDRSIAEGLARAVDGSSGPVRFKKERKHRAPPKLYNLTGLSSAAATLFDWSPDKTLSVAQDLYATHELITYPRTESKYLPENYIQFGPALMTALLDLPEYQAHKPLLGQPKYRRGESGHYYDKDVEASNHHAIMPNFNVADRIAQKVANLSADARDLFHLICRSWLAAHAPDHLYDRTSVDYDCPWSGHVWTFHGAGNAVVSQGWKAILDDDEEGKAEPIYPAIIPGEVVRASDPSVLLSKTKPPARYTYASLGVILEQAWRLVSDPEQRAILKNSKGIGTDATRASILQTLMEQKQIAKHGKHIVPTQMGMSIYDLIMGCAPNVADPARTALWEMIYLDVEAKRLSVEDAVLKIIKGANAEIKRIVESYNPKIVFGVEKRPTPKMLELAKKISAERGIPMPTGTITRAEICKKFIDEHLQRRDPDAGPIPPSEKQLAMLQRLAQGAGVDIPEEALATSRACSVLIDQLIKHPANQQADRAPTENQVNYAKKLAASAGVDVPPEILASMRACSDFIEKLSGRSQGESKGGAGATGNGSSSNGKSYPPSEKQISFAKSLAEKNKVKLPAKVLTDAMACSAFIKSQMGKSTSAAR